MAFKAKIILGTLSTLGVGGMSVGGHVLTNPWDIEGILVEKGKIPLSTALLGVVEYGEEEYKEDLNLWKELITDSEAKDFGRWSDDSGENEKINKLKLRCMEVMKISYFSWTFSEMLEKAEKFCFKK